MINIWWAQTINDRNPIPSIEPIIALYPKIGFRELVEIISEVIPSAGKYDNVNFWMAQEPKQGADTRLGFHPNVATLLLLYKYPISKSLCQTIDQRSVA